MIVICGQESVESAVCDHIFDLPEQNRRVAVEWVAGGIFGSENGSSQLRRAAAQKTHQIKNATSNMVNGNTPLLDNGPNIERAKSTKGRK